MNKYDITGILKSDLSLKSEFENWRGISQNNLRQFLVDPYPADVFGEYPKTPPVKMWIVLHEKESPPYGNTVGYDQVKKEWYVAKHTREGQYLCDTVGNRHFADALNHM